MSDLYRVGGPLQRRASRTPPHGDWTYLEGEPSNEGAYGRLEFDREETVDRLRLLARYADQVAGSGHDLYILHLGV
jgi:hypothetical protein